MTSRQAGLASYLSLERWKYNIVLIMELVILLIDFCHLVLPPLQAILAAKLQGNTKQSREVLKIVEQLSCSCRILMQVLLELAFP